MTKNKWINKNKKSNHNSKGGHTTVLISLKNVIRKFVHEDAKNWDKWLEPLLFAVREVPQASSGFSPFELLNGRRA